MAQPTGARKRRNDILLIAGVLLVAALAWVGLGGGLAVIQGALGMAPATSGTTWAVIQNAEGYRQVVDLSKDAVYQVDSSLGHNEITVQGGRISDSEADCENQVCVNTGWVSHPGDVIVCLPHKLVVQVVSDPSEASELKGLLGSAKE